MISRLQHGKSQSSILWPECAHNHRRFQDTPHRTKYGGVTWKPAMGLTGGGFTKYIKNDANEWEMQSL